MTTMLRYLVVVATLFAFAVSECPAGFELIQGSCFYFGDILFSWADARLHCFEMKGDLANIDTFCHLADLIQCIHINKFEIPNGTSYWVSGNDNKEEGMWQWIDGTPMDVPSPYWGTASDGSQEPNGGTDENCAALEKDDQYFLHDDNCFVEHYSICQTTPLGY